MTSIAESIDRKGLNEEDEDGLRKSLSSVDSATEETSSFGTDPEEEEKSLLNIKKQPKYKLSTKFKNEVKSKFHVHKGKRKSKVK